ncbi:Alpha/Beta hydrolase protein [Delphinella strobiligena]|nr:Alpha/Beta hydrolase protein [Delphinella strobiligena]
MDLSSTFQYHGWDIKYALLESENTTTSNEAIETNPIVFVHGTPWSSVVFKPLIHALLAKGACKILVYDLPGYGQSQKYANNAEAENTKKLFQGDTSVKFQAETLTALLSHTQLNDKKPAVIAHDIAGTIVLRAHLLHNCEFESMLLVDANAVLPWGDGFYELVRESPAPFLALPLRIFEAVVRAVTKSAVHNPQVLQSGWEDLLAEPWIDSVAKQKSFVRQIAQANDAAVAEMLEGELYGRVRCRVKIIWGEQDQWIPREKIEEFRRRPGGGGGEFVGIPEAEHLVMLDQPERFAIEVFEWLSRSV